MRAGIDRRAMTLLGGGHLATDLANGALPALVPYLRDRFQLSYTLAAVLMLASSASSSVVQPLFGVWSDRHGALWLLPGGVALAGVGIAAAADAPSYGLVLGLVVLSGLGVAAYHPEGTKFAAYASGSRRASGMSAFSIGGNVGFALGPILVGAFVGWFGLRGGFTLALPGLIAAGALLVGWSSVARVAPSAEQRRRVAVEGEDMRGALGVLLSLIGFRSLAWFGLLTFVPLWEVSLGHSKAHGAHLLAAMLVAGGVGTVAAGPLADRFGYRRILLLSLVATPPLIAAYIAVGGVAGAVCVTLVGPCVVGTFGLTTVLGGVGAVVLGAVADAVDLRTAMWAAAAAPVVAVALGFLLPSGLRGAPVALRPVPEP